ncbi:MAG: DHH family phosphoesterase, partial [Thermoplasmata archaeon]|nr:DHH family phosphoesterase [Thermoplasmata archaeon]
MKENSLLDAFRGIMKPAAEAISGFEGLVRVVSHYDADGIAAAGIMAKALLRERKRFRISFVKGINSEVFKALDHEGFVIALDMGSGQMDEIRKLEATVIICDHHVTPEFKKGMKEKKEGKRGEMGGSEDGSEGNDFSDFASQETEKGMVYEFNCHKFGINGSYAACAATITYALATALSRMNSPSSAMAIAGMFGDKQSTPLLGLNKEVVEEGVAQGYVQEKKASLFLDGGTVSDALTYSVDPYFPGLTGRESSVQEFLNECGIEGSKSPESLQLNERRFLTDRLMLILLKNNSPPEAVEGIVGTRYYLSEFGVYADVLSNRLNASGRQDWMTTGLAVCLGEKRAMEKATRLREKYRSTIRNGLVYLESRGIKKTDHLQYFFNNDPASSGTFAGLGIQFLFDRHLPIIGLSKKEDKVHISARGTRELVDKGLDLSTAMRDAGSRVGGYGGGHPIASGATIPKGKENEFLKIVDGIVGKQFEGA